MVMTEIFDKLKKLQSILARKYELEKIIDEAPKQLNSQDELLSRMRKEFIEKNADYELVKSKVFQLRSELDEAVKKRETGEKNMDNITTHREYEALEKQISEASSKETVVRKELQKEEKNLDELNDILKSTEEMIKTQENELNLSKESLDKQISGYKDELNGLCGQEENIIPGMDQEILFKFQRIIQRNSEGIVAVKNGVCTGCNMILPAQFANEVHEGENILFCPYCSRILYHEDSDENLQESYFSDAGSLADIDDEFEEDDYSDDYSDLEQYNEDLDESGDNDISDDEFDGIDDEDTDDN